MKISAQDFLFINYSKHVWLDQHVWVHFSLEVDLENFLLCKITASSFSLTSLFFFVVVFCDWKWREVRYEVTIAVRRSPWANRNGREKVFPFSLTLISLNPNSTWKWSTENKKHFEGLTDVPKCIYRIWTNINVKMQFGDTFSKRY